MKKEQKQQLLLQYLNTHNEDWINGNEIIYILQISIRQLRNYVKELNEQYPSLIWSSAQGYWLNPKVYEQINQTNRKTMGVEQRRKVLLRELITSNKVDLFELESSYHISIPTLENDLTQLRLTLKDYEMVLERDHELLHLLGSELQKRSLLCDLYLTDLHLQFVSNDFFTSSAAQVHSILNRLGFTLTQSNFLTLLSYLHIAMNRTAQGCFLEDVEQDSTTPYDQELISLFPYLALPQEQAMLQRFLSACKPSIQDKQIQAQIIHALSILQNIFSFQYAEELITCLVTWYQQELSMRLQFSFGRAHRESQAITFPLIHKVSCLLHRLLHLEPQPCSMYEATQLLSAFLVFPSYNKVQASLLYTDRLIAKQLKRELQLRFPRQLQIINQQPWQNFQNLEPSSDMIIATIDAVYPAAYLYLPIAYSEKDMKKARDIIQHKYYKKARQRLLTWFQKNKAQLYWIHAASQEDLEEALNSCTLLSAEALEQLASEQGFPAFYGPLYFPHLLNQSQSSFIIITLMKPLLVQNQEITTLFLASFSKLDQDAYNEWIDQLVWILSDKYFLKRCKEGEHTADRFLTMLEEGSVIYAQHKEQVT